MIDIAPLHSADVMGLSNTIATIPGIVGNTVTGYILDLTNSWLAVFGGFFAFWFLWFISILSYVIVTAVVYVVGGVLFCFLADDQPVQMTAIMVESQKRFVYQYLQIFRITPLNIDNFSLLPS